MYPMYQGKYRCLNHLMPVKGWMNDPNGLCYYKGQYHIFFQANPEFPNGGKKRWGHYTTPDFKVYTYHGICIDADSSYDLDGVYSGSSIVKDETLYLFYTGNYKEPGAYDYIRTGRKSTVLRVSSEDGIHFTNKKVILTNEDYPEICTCHVRDPKIYEQDGVYYMLLGARLVDDVGAILIYKSTDLDHFSFVQLLRGNQLGFMLECPDLFKLDNQYIFSFSPQGLIEEHESFRNLYSAGYTMNGISKQLYHEWDKGYDFYAPQTFRDSQGRQLLIGWAGLDDERLTISYAPTLEENWMHVLTCPRELRLKNNWVYQYPVEEIFQLAESYEEKKVAQDKSYLAMVENEDQNFELLISNSFKIGYNKGILAFEFLNHAYGRTPRQLTVKKCQEILIFMDASIVEVFINHGEYVFTSRVFNEAAGFELIQGNVKCKIAKMRAFEYEKITSNR